MLSCAYNLAVIYNLKKKLSKEIAKLAFSLINDVRDTQNSRWILEPAEILLNLDILNHSSSYLMSILQRGTKVHSQSERWSSRTTVFDIIKKFVQIPQIEY